MSRYGSGLSRSEIYHEELDDEERAASRRPVSSLPVGHNAPARLSPERAYEIEHWDEIRAQRAQANSGHERSGQFVGNQQAREAYARQTVQANAKTGEAYDARKIHTP